MDCAPAGTCTGRVQAWANPKLDKAPGVISSPAETEVQLQVKTIMGKRTNKRFMMNRFLRMSAAPDGRLEKGRTPTLYASRLSAFQRIFAETLFKQVVRRFPLW